MNELLFAIYYAVAKYMRDDLFTEADYVRFLAGQPSQNSLENKQTIAETNDMYQIIDSIVQETYHLTHTIRNKAFWLKWKPVLEELLSIKLGQTKKEITVDLESYSHQLLTKKAQIYTPPREQMESLINLTMDYQHQTKKLYTYPNYQYKVVSKEKVMLKQKSDVGSPEHLSWFYPGSDELKVILQAHNLEKKIQLKTMFNDKSIQEVLHKEYGIGFFFVLKNGIKINEGLCSLPETKRLELENKLNNIIQQKMNCFLQLNNELDKKLSKLKR
jgi:hypothetical protein